MLGHRPYRPARSQRGRGWLYVHFRAETQELGAPVSPLQAPQPRRCGALTCGTGGVAHLGPTIDWALGRLDRRLSVDDLATHAGMSRRNFTRRFAEATGSTPARWVLARRLVEARRWLETTSTPIARAAAACGFASVVTFRQNFVSACSTTPTSYRQRFALTPGDDGPS
ncbi:hypothetical protein CF165_31330 [Amycolatopsis vastitatis]|uniref:HTH araC/xylS-type domain-containing protein n=2 Tax=Amycolatopsis vastitatis TaxID=1905142 RepID=A0A229SWQ6_9PSEU|nr:hypothetical protein CF165_31330 [Amycolatopsis vastitatis]